MLRAATSARPWKSLVVRSSFSSASANRMLEISCRSRNSLSIGFALSPHPLDAIGQKGAGLDASNVFVQRTDDDFAHWLRCVYAGNVSDAAAVSVLAPAGKRKRLAHLRLP